MALPLIHALTLAGMRTRMVFLSTDVDHISLGNHITVEYYSVGQKKWVLVEGMSGTIPHDGAKSLGIFEVFGSAEQLAELNEVESNYRPSAVVTIILPDPTYDTAVEIYWTPGTGVIAAGKAYHEAGQ